MKLLSTTVLSLSILTVALSIAGEDKAFEFTGQILADEESVFILRTEK